MRESASLQDQDVITSDQLFSRGAGNGSRRRRASLSGIIHQDPGKFFDTGICQGILLE